MSKIIDDNFNLHSWKIPALTGGMLVFKKPTLTFVDSSLSCDTFNVVHIINGKDITLADVTEAIKHYRDKNLAYCIWVSEENLTENLKNIFVQLGIKKHNEEPGMILSIDRYKPIHSELHKNALIAHTFEHVNDFAEVIAKNWTPADQNVISYFNATAPHYISNADNIFLAIYYQDNKPVSVLEMFSTDKENVGLYALATLQEYRGKGIGTALMTFALNKLKAMNYKNVILQASEDGIGIYQKLGFEVKTRYFEFA